MGPFVLAISPENSEGASTKLHALSSRVQFVTKTLSELKSVDLGPITCAIFDHGFMKPAMLETAATQLAVLGDMPRLHLLAERTLSLRLQAAALGANSVLEAPFNQPALIMALQELWSCATAETRFKLDSPVISTGRISSAEARAATSAALTSAFAAIQSGLPPRLQTLLAASDALICSLRDHSAKDKNLSNWLATIQAHHSPTFRHSAMVAGYALMFAQHLKFPDNSARLLTLAGLIHDIGKAVVPLAVLDKPGPLTPEERLRVERHPVVGRDMLKGMAGLPKCILHAVAHHHEYLDGSGYPDRLHGEYISDFTRIITVVDIFSALVEERSYKRPLGFQQALEILSNLVKAGRLDEDLVREFSTMIMYNESCSSDKVDAYIS